MFQITEFVEAHVASVTNRIEKHGDDDKPAVTLRVEITAANTLLDTIDPTLRHALYKAKPDEEPELPGVEQSTPVLRCNSIEKVPLITAHEGWTLQLDDGIDDTDPMVFGGVKVDKLVVEPKQGGSIVLSVRLGTSDVDAERLGVLAVHNGRSVWIKLLKPEVKAEQKPIDGTGEEFRRDHPLLDQVGDEGAGQASKDELDASGNNPFAQTPERALAAAGRTPCA